MSIISAHSIDDPIESGYFQIVAGRTVAQLRLFGRRGGKRRGAGRKSRRTRPGSPHRRRAKLLARHPVHVVLRAADDVGNLRRRDTYLAVQKATEMVADQDDFRITHLSVQRNHLHVVAEAANEAALSWNMQRFQISAARRINAAILDADGARRRGAVFPDRFHATVIKTPTQARNVIGYLRFNRPIDQTTEPDASMDALSAAARLSVVEEVAPFALAM
jgi:REP element-mobilizing transposase RayT